MRSGNRGDTPSQALGGDEDSGAPGLGPLVNHLLGRQLLIVLGVSALAFAFGLVPGYSALLGALVSLVANAYFAHKVLADDGKASAGRVVLVFYWAESVKIAMAAVLLAALGALIEEINVMALIGGFAAAHIGAALSAAGVVPARAGPSGRS